jgi:hypothetical protein
MWKSPARTLIRRMIRRNRAVCTTMVRRLSRFGAELFASRLHGGTHKRNIILTYR